MAFRKVILAPVLGVDYSVKSYAIDPRSWLTLQQFRNRSGIVQNFPGWTQQIGLTGFGCHLIWEHIPANDVAPVGIIGEAASLKQLIWPATASNITGAVVVSATLDEPLVATYFAGNTYITCRNTLLAKFLGSGNFVPLGINIGAKSIASILNYLCLLNVKDAGTVYNQRFQWASEGSDITWVAAANNSAGFFDLDETPDKGQSLQRLGSSQLIAYKSESIVPIMYVGGAAVFDKGDGILGIGCVGPYACANLGDKHIFLGYHNFYEYSGGSKIRPLGDKVRNLLFNTNQQEPAIDDTYANRTRSVWIRATNEILFAYVSVGSVDHTPDYAIVYNVDDEVWSSPFHFSCSMLGRLFHSATFDVQNEFGQEKILYGNAPQAGNAILYTIGNSQSADGVSIERVMESGDQLITRQCEAENGQLVNLPYETIAQLTDMLFEYEDVSTTMAKLYVSGRDRYADGIEWKGPFEIKSAKSSKCVFPQRITGRWFRFKIIAPQSSKFNLCSYEWSFESVGRLI